MSRITVTFERDSKFPEWAIPEVLKTMHREGKSLRKIADMFGVSAEAVRLRILKAKQS